MASSEFPPLLLDRLLALSSDFGPKMVAAAAAFVAVEPYDPPTFDQLVGTVEDIKEAVAGLRRYTRDSVTAERERDAEEAHTMTTLAEDLRAVEGNVAQAVASIGAEVSAAADRISAMIAADSASDAANAAALTDAQGNAVQAGDVSGLTEIETRLRAMGDAIRALGEDSGSMVPPVEDATPITEVDQAVEDATPTEDTTTPPADTTTPTEDPGTVPEPSPVDNSGTPVDETAPTDEPPAQPSARRRR